MRDESLGGWVTLSGGLGPSDKKYEDMCENMSKFRKIRSDTRESRVYSFGKRTWELGGWEYLKIRWQIEKGCGYSSEVLRRIIRYSSEVLSLSKSLFFLGTAENTLNLGRLCKTFRSDIKSIVLHVELH